MPRPLPTLCAIVLSTCGQDLRGCALCGRCSAALDEGMDVTVRQLMQMVLADDADVLESRTLWSRRVFRRAPRLCPFGLNMELVLLALREEAWRRGVVETII